MVEMHLERKIAGAQLPVPNRGFSRFCSNRVAFRNQISEAFHSTQSSFHSELRLSYKAFRQGKNMKRTLAYGLVLCWIGGGACHELKHKRGGEWKSSFRRRD